jgi:hypothetical protein
MRRRVRGVLEDVANTAQESDVQRIADDLRRGALEGARSPGGRVEFVGRHVDATGVLDAASVYLTGLEGLDAASISALARELMSTDPVELEIR